MQRVVIVAPSASYELPPSADGSASDALAWLGAALAQRGFRVTVIDDTDVAGEITRAAEGSEEEDVLLVHLSGRLARKGVLRAGGGRWLALRDVGGALGSLPCQVCIIAAVLHEEEGADAISAAEHVASVVASIGAREQGFTMVSAIRPATSDAAPFAFSRLLFEAADDAGPGATLSAAYDHVTSSPEGLAAAQSFTLVRGLADISFGAEPAAAPDFDSLIAAATEAQQWPRVVELRRARLPALSSDMQARELVSLARVLQVELGQAEAAIEALEEARTLDPTRVGVLQALRRGYEKLGRWASAIEVVSALAGLEQSGAERAELRVALATMVLDYLQDEDRAVALVEAAVRDDPSNAAALAELQRLRPSPATPQQAEIAEVAEIVEEASTRALPTFRDSVPPSERLPVSEGDPLDPATHARAFDERMRGGQTDAAFLSALALEDLGAARPEHLALIEKRRTTAPIRPRASLDDAAWARPRSRIRRGARGALRRRVSPELRCTRRAAHCP